AEFLESHAFIAAAPVRRPGVLFPVLVSRLPHHMGGSEQLASILLGSGTAISFWRHSVPGFRADTGIWIVSADRNAGKGRLALFPWPGHAAVWPKAGSESGSRAAISRVRSHQWRAN